MLHKAKLGKAGGRGLPAPIPESDPMDVVESEADQGYAAMRECPTASPSAQPSRPKWDLTIQVKPLNVQQVHYETGANMLQGNQYLTQVDGQYMLHGIGQCIQALDRRDNELA
jgi:hypothetical protein